MTIDIPGYKAGTYVLDSSHSDVNFEVRHMMISKVRGKFLVKQATLVLPENPLDATVEATADVASVDTNDEGRDGHLRSADFFDAENFPTISFASTGVREQGDGLVVDGDLTIKDVTRAVTFSLELGGFGSDPWGNYKGGATAEATIDREEFGLNWNAALETGGVLVGKTVKITLDLQGTLQA
ncbi:polyisoprenoid-binding protein [Microbacterium faecale]|uniref:Polyisoprenoid-binding protein n=1 Tax=Microbacterium faecale TaxID=1804630 RepID=A0A916YG19_9MICO|nr:YceI family protein [Microbacterium faecale]GGD43967.1 polyisoprenoid-binding protein [Microbacterium faecale]